MGQDGGRRAAGDGQVMATDVVLGWWNGGCDGESAMGNKGAGPRLCGQKKKTKERMGKLVEGKRIGRGSREGEECLNTCCRPRFKSPPCPITGVLAVLGRGIS
ncbi:hypothetical protein Dimus_003254 [Dionaea muscipula]